MTTREWLPLIGLTVSAFLVNTSEFIPVGLLTDPTMKKIAEAHGKSTAQVSLRWIIQQGVLPLPKSVHVDRIRQNMDLFDFELSDDEMKEISSLSGLGGQCADPDDVDF